jgi:hypothetical protein
MMSINHCIKLGVRFSKENVAETVITMIIGLFLGIHFGILLAADAMQKWEMASDDVGKIFEEFAVVVSWIAAGCRPFLVVSLYLGPIFSCIDSCSVLQKIKQCLCARCGGASDATNLSPKRSVAYGYGEHDIYVVDLTKNGLCIEKTIHLGKEHCTTSFTLLRVIKKIYMTPIYDGSVTLLGVGWLFLTGLSNGSMGSVDLSNRGTVRLRKCRHPAATQEPTTANSSKILPTLSDAISHFCMASAASKIPK